MTERGRETSFPSSFTPRAIILRPFLTDVELTYLSYILYHLTGTLGGASLHFFDLPPPAFCFLSARLSEGLRKHNACKPCVSTKHEGCTCERRGSPD